ncbi:DUF1214 domain-containing protein [Psychrilyobacter piezotolerans]|uniref:DUF1214 domain-containing protein n=2 Tax=Fusobacteriaceae TaxID=203492 RepID=A0ABX9KEY2_9FUSO|nr:DUF1254 domain-containing protein [Psychrilyobacter sp. S5]NDI78800.1 DUF1254 domain-containing protein [Psychrilyobacter piezotolerans]RDE59534.1 DUF1254 domain-containing protein [Psychrilyobacter sp. S5]REI39974.1 DUF1214 domain-containing protein [Psychrilyobacter piezotolerans]
MIVLALTGCSNNPGELTFQHHNHLANLEFDRGYPTADSAEALQQELAFQRATQAYLWALPITNMRAMQEGHAELMDGTAYNKIAIYEDRLKAHTIITTPNSDVIYGLAWLDMKDTGPLVIEMPAALQTLVDDMLHDALIGPEKEDGTHYLGDIGNAGPDRGKGGLFLILPPGVSREGYDSNKYFIYESNTYEVFLFLRSFFEDMNNTTPAVDRMKEIKIYPLIGDAEPMEYHEVSDIPSNSISPKDWTYFEQLDRTIQAEPILVVDPYMNGILASLGIKKGYKFNPSDAEKEMLTLAAQTGWKIAKEVSLNFDEKGRDTVGHTTFWEESPSWVAHALTDEEGNQYTAGSDTSYNSVETGHTNVDAKMHMYINHYSISDAMINAKIGQGAKYAGAYKDSDGEYLRGECTYSITLPNNIPAGLFWSITAYDAETAAGVPSNNKYPSIGDRDNPIQNADGSTTLWFGPSLPEGAYAENYVHIPKDTNWFALIRLYGPQKSLFTGEWIPGEFIKIESN